MKKENGMNKVLVGLIGLLALAVLFWLGLIIGRGLQ